MPTINSLPWSLKSFIIINGITGVVNLLLIIVLFSVSPSQQQIEEDLYLEKIHFSNALPIQGIVLDKEVLNLSFESSKVYQYKLASLNQNDNKKWIVFSKENTYEVGEPISLFTSKNGKIKSFRNAYYNDTLFLTPLYWTLYIGLIFNICFGLNRYHKFKHARIYKVKVQQIYESTFRGLLTKYIIKIKSSTFNQPLFYTSYFENSIYTSQTIYILVHPIYLNKIIPLERFPKSVYKKLLEYYNLERILKKHKRNQLIDQRVKNKTD